MFNLSIPKAKGAISYDVTNRGLEVTYNDGRHELLLSNKRLASLLDENQLSIDSKTGELKSILKETDNKAVSPINESKDSKIEVKQIEASIIDNEPLPNEISENNDSLNNSSTSVETTLDEVPLNDSPNTTESPKRRAKKVV